MNLSFIKHIYEYVKRYKIRKVFVPGCNEPLDVHNTPQKKNEERIDLNNVLTWLLAIIIEKYKRKSVEEFAKIFDEKYSMLLAKSKSDLPLFWKMNDRKIKQAVYRYRDYFHENKTIRLNEGELLAFFLAISFQLVYHS